MTQVEGPSLQSRGPGSGAVPVVCKGFLLSPHLGNKGCAAIPVPRSIFVSELVKIWGGECSEHWYLLEGLYMGTVHLGMRLGRISPKLRM